MLGLNGKSVIHLIEGLIEAKPKAEDVIAVVDSFLKSVDEIHINKDGEVVIKIKKEL